MTSHDRAFMNRVISRIVEAANRTIITYSGNNDFYLQEREIRREQLLASHRRQQEMLAKEEATSPRTIWTSSPARCCWRPCSSSRAPWPW